MRKSLLFFAMFAIVWITMDAAAIPYDRATTLAILVIGAIHLAILIWLWLR